MSLQKFKILATRCAAASGNPTQSPTTSPVIHLRRRKTLRMLLSRSGSSGGADRSFLHRRGGHDEEESEEDLAADRRRTEDSRSAEGVVKRRTRQSQQQMSSRVRQKLKDLMISSPPAALGVGDGRKKREVNGDEDEARGRLLPADGARSRGREFEARRGSGFGVGGATMRPLSATLRQRLLRRVWRPVLVAIPETSP